jgi:hypothetical protein
MFKRIILLSFLGCFCAPALCADFSRLNSIRDITFQGGFHTSFYNNVQNDTSGGTRKFDLSPTIGAGMVLPSPWKFLLIPEINWVLPRYAGSDRIIKNLIMFRFDIAYDPLEWLRLRLGTSFMWQNIHGRGGKANVSNGNSTSTFYYPDENRSALNNTFDIGIETFFNQKWSLRLQTYTYSLFKEERRQLSYTFFINYYWNIRD